MRTFKIFILEWIKLDTKYITFLVYIIAAGIIFSLYSDSSTSPIEAIIVSIVICPIISTSPIEAIIVSIVISPIIYGILHLFIFAALKILFRNFKI